MGNGDFSYIGSEIGNSIIVCLPDPVRMHSCTRSVYLVSLRTTLQQQQQQQQSSTLPVHYNNNQIHGKVLESDWLRAVQLLCNSAQKCVISCRNL